MRDNPCRRWKNDPDLPPENACVTCGYTEEDHWDQEDDTVDARRGDQVERQMLAAEDRAAGRFDDVE